MKPLNRDSDSCDPISSECVIWQGRDIECIKLCKGDTVSDVVGKLATELCEIMDSLDITGYDLSCFNITSCPPEDFHKLIQFLIERICKLEQCTGCIPDCKGTDPNIFPIPTSDGCPNCIVSIAPCFYFLNPFGDTVTTMQLSDYVTAIGNKVCTIAGQIATMQATLLNHSIRLAHLESIPPPVLSLPTITPICVLPPTPTDIAAVLQTLEQQFCMLRSATG